MRCHRPSAATGQWSATRRAARTDFGDAAPSKQGMAQLLICPGSTTEGIGGPASGWFGRRRPEGGRHREVAAGGAEELESRRLRGEICTAVAGE